MPPFDVVLLASRCDGGVIQGSIVAVVDNTVVASDSVLAWLACVDVGILPTVVSLIKTVVVDFVVNVVMVDDGIMVVGDSFVVLEASADDTVVEGVDDDPMLVDPAVLEEEAMLVENSETEVVEEAVKVADDELDPAVEVKG